MTYEKLWLRHVHTPGPCWRIHQTILPRTSPASPRTWWTGSRRGQYVGNMLENIGILYTFHHIPIMTGWWLVACPIFPFRDVWYSCARSLKLVMATARARLKASLMRTRGGVWKLGGISSSVAKHPAGSGCSRKPMGLWVSQFLVVPIWVWKNLELRKAPTSRSTPWTHVLRRQILPPKVDPLTYYFQILFSFSILVWNGESGF